jgi:hypothetical protein
MAIREEDSYGGLRVRMNARINNVRCALQIDVGYGDVVTPDAQTAVFPALLEGLQAPSLRVYPVYTVIAEKYQAMVLLGLANTRLKDFYDLAVIAKRTTLDGALLAQAIAATFNRRGTPLPIEPSAALTASFGDHAAKQLQWRGFLNKSGIEAEGLAETVSLLQTLLWPATQVAPAASSATASWDPVEQRWCRT